MMTKDNMETPIILQVKYHNKNNPKLAKIEVGNWIDLRSAENVEMKSGDFKLISLGISVKLPAGYEANIVPRSSTFGKYGIIQTNSYGVIDTAYCGDNDIWKFPAYAIRDTVIHEGDRICQFRVNKTMPDIEFVEVENLGETDRGGFGSTGVS